ncbi:MAG: acetate--CoA ligase family protein [Chloroflexi bacterium]|jgi:acyl-CoA synthetase (NDP forming)|nr:acetate--CoA ligase family protein [Chloroflexota bacterium]
MTKAEILAKAGKEKRSLLTEIESKELLKAARIPVVETRLATSKKEAMEIAVKLGFPVVMKIVSPDVVHKSDAGGVKLSIQNASQAGRAYSEILANIKKHYPKAKITGVTVQKMAKQGIEVIIGMTKDAQFGPVIMFGLGGILVEVLKDVSFRIVPMTKRDASEMIGEIKGYPILKGYRGQDPADIPFLEDLIVKVSQFVDKNPEIKELDLNPVFAYKDGALAVDARIILESAA